MDLDNRSAARRRGLDRGFLASLDRDFEAARGAPPLRYDPQPAHRAQRRQRLAPEAQRADVLQIPGRELRGGVALHAERQIRLVHAAAVVAHAQKRQPAILRDHLDGGGASVDGVLNQLLDRARGPLDHLAGGDPVDLDLA